MKKTILTATAIIGLSGIWLFAQSMGSPSGNHSYDGNKEEKCGSHGCSSGHGFMGMHMLNGENEEMKKAFIEFRNEQVYPVLKELRVQLDKKLTTEEKATIANARAEMTTKRSTMQKTMQERMKQGEKPSLEKREEMMKMHQEMKKLMAPVKKIAEDHADDLSEFREGVKPHKKEWHEQMKNMHEKFGSESKNKSHQCKHGKGHDGDHKAKDHKCDHKENHDGNHKCDHKGNHDGDHKCDYKKGKKDCCKDGKKSCKEGKENCKEGGETCKNGNESHMMKMLMLNPDADSPEEFFPHPGNLQGENIEMGSEKDLVKMKIYPNPTQNQSTIEYEVKKSGNIHIELCDNNGTSVKSLFNGYKEAGKYSLNVDLSDMKGKSFYVRYYSNDVMIGKKLLKVE